MIFRDPFTIGRFTLGYARVGVFTYRWGRFFESLQRSVTWRVANWNVERHATTGRRYPDYSITHTINGILVEQGGSMPSFALGIYMQQDAIFLCFDGVKPMDQIVVGNKYFEVAQIEEHYDLQEGGFAFRVCHLHRLELFKEI